MAHEDWDLFAIVQSCKAATFTASSSTTTTETPPPTTTTNITRPPQNTATSCLEAFSTVSQENGSFPFPNIVQPRTNNGFLELHQLLMNFNPTTTTGSSTTTSCRGINPNSTTFSDLAGLIGQQQMQQGLHHPVPVPTTYSSIGASSTSFDRFHHHHQQQQQPQPTKQQQQEPNQLPLQVPQTSSMVLPSTQPQTPRSRKRKSQQKKMVCHVTADNLSTDLWAWRKYGQKPIKGSPYPRNYYRCSSCKGCAARKQVERSTTEPNMFIVTYTGDHKHAKPVHRNSLAGSARNKPPTTRLPSAGETGSPPNTGSVSSSSSVFPPTLLQSDPPENGDAHVAAVEPEGADPETEPDAGSDDDDVLIPNLAAMSDAFLLGLGQFDGGGAEPSFGSDPNSVPGLNRSSYESSSNNIRSSPG